jgi:hypothetical protein
MRKIHLRCVLDEDLNVSITLCGLAETPKRPMTDAEADVTCSRCKEELALIKEAEAEKSKKPSKKKEKPKTPVAEKPVADTPADGPKKTRKPRAPKKEDREREMERERKRAEDPYVLCLHCQKVHEKKDYVKKEGMEWCPENCGGTLFADGWSWNLLREEHPELNLPEAPEIGKYYALHDGETDA